MYVISNIEFYPDGTCALGFTEIPGDFRENGLVLRRQVVIPGDVPATADQVQAIHAAAQRALEAAMHAVSNSRALSLEELEPGLEAAPPPEDDDTPGPYDNPNERDL